MISGKRHLNIVALLLAITLVFGYAMPAFAQETPGGAISIGESSAGDESVKCTCPTIDGVAITHLAECPFYTAPAQACTCTEKCVPADAESGVEAVINADCPVCDVEDADLSLCQGAAAIPPEDGAPVLLLAAAPVSILALGDVTIDETNFPDVKFRAWLQNSSNIGDAGSDSVLTTEEIAGIKQIYMSRLGIRDLTGIELFTSLTALQCSYNYNPFTVPNGLPDSLTSLFFIDNDLTELPNLPSGLVGLNCSGNKLTELPSLPITLKGLNCSKNALTALDLTGLDVLNISSDLYASGQSAYIALLSNGAGGFEAPIDLNTPTFGATGISYASGKLKSNSNTITETTFTDETGKTGATLSGTLHLSYPAEGSIEINATNFPDAKFRAILKSPDIWSGIEGLGKDGYLSPDEIAKITYLYLDNQGISDFTGIALFTALESFDCRQNALVALPTLPGGLKTLTCDENKLTALPDLPSGLKKLYCFGNELTVFLTLPDGLIGLDCSYNPLTAPPTLPSGLKWLNYAGIGPTMLPTALPTTLTELDCSDNGLTTLDLAGLTSLYRLNCSDNNLTELDLSGLGSLNNLDCSGNWLTELDVSGLSMLEELYCVGNLLTTLDVSSLAELEELDCSANWLTVLNVSGLDSLYNLNCAGNSLTTLDVSSLDALEGLNCSGNLLTSLNLAGLSSLCELNCSSNQLTALDLSSFSTAGYFYLQADDQTPRLTLLGSDAAGYSVAIALNNPSGWAADISYIGGVLKSTRKGITSTPFSVDTGLAGASLSGTLLLTYGGGSPGTAPAITTTSLLGGRVGSSYSRSFAATGDTPITWSLDGGSLPDGLKLSSGGVISGTPAVRGTFTFTVKAVNSEGDDTKTFSIEITRSSGGSSGGGSGSSSSGTTIIIQPEKKPGQPVIAGFNAIPTMDRNGNTTVTISEKSVADAIVKALADAKAQGKTANGIGIAINIDLPEASKSLGIVLPRATLKSLVDAGVRQFEINGVTVSLNLNLEALQEIQKQSSGNVTISITPVQNLSSEARTLIGTRPVYNITITYVKDGKTVNITSLGNGSATLSIPYTPGQNEAVGYLFGVYVDGNGKAARIAGSTYNANTRTIIFSTGHFSVYGVGYTAPSAKFTDISTHWARESIDYVVGRGLFSGTTDTAFAPDTAMTRGMLVTTLGRLSGADVSNYKTSSFTDVKAASAFLPYIEWAYTKGIIHGIGNDMFAPDRLIYREEIALILQNYATATGYTFPVIRETTSFADNSSIGSSYRDAVKAMQQAGIMIGDNNNKFNPKAGATRAEAASMLHRYIKLTIAPLNNTGLGEE